MASGGMDSDLDWRKHISEEYHDLPLHALKSRTVRRIGLFLDEELDSMDMDCEVMRDFSGLADLIGFDGLEIQSFERSHEKGKMVLQEWMRNNELKPTIGRLLTFLTQMEREDILTEILITHQYIENDAKLFLKRREDFQPVQVGEVTPGPGEPEEPELCTFDDVMHGTQTKYDAFVCYNPAEDGSEDFRFVQELIQKFESPPYNFKLFVPHRNDLAGLNSHSINAKIISQRCRHMIVVLSNNFLQSKACDFQTSFAHALSPGARSKRMVPVKLEEVIIPNIMKIMALCDFTKSDLRDWSWVRLAQSIRVPLKACDFEIRSSPNSAMLPIESLWSRQSPSDMCANPTAGPSVPVISGFGETGPSSIADSAIGTGSQSPNHSHRTELPHRQYKSHTAPVASSSALDSSSSTESLSSKSSTSVMKVKKSPNSPGELSRGQKRIQIFQRPFQKLRELGRKKDTRTAEDMETGV